MELKYFNAYNQTYIPYDLQSKMRSRASYFQNSIQFIGQTTLMC